MPNPSLPRSGSATSTGQPLPAANGELDPLQGFATHRNRDIVEGASSEFLEATLFRTAHHPAIFTAASLNPEIG
jgi:hypothetical protein